MGIFRKSASASVDVAAIAQQCETGCWGNCVGTHCSNLLRHELVSSMYRNKVIELSLDHTVLSRQTLSGKLER